MVSAVLSPEKKKIQKSRRKANPELQFVTIDLSFVPAEKLPPELQSYTGKEVINPYVADRTEMLKSLGGCAIAFKRLREAEQTFNDFDFAFRKFALDRFIAKDLKLAEQSFLYLINMNNTDSREKDHLLKIYDNLFN